MTDKSNSTKDVHEVVKDYYGKELITSSDLKTNACSTADAYPSYIKKLIANVHPEVVSKYYGCGLTIPTKLEGSKIVDLGSGAGRDVYIASQLVGQNGSVIGVDMTDEQIAVAEKHLDYHQEKFGYKTSNTTFKKAYLEELSSAGIERDSVDVIISNCVINLVKDKEAVLRSCYELLKEGGEVYFSDVYASRRIPDALVADELLYGECLSGALYWNDFENLSKKVGFADPRLVESSEITIENPALQEMVGDIKFYSMTYRLFKIAELEPDCEDYGQAVIYRGSVAQEEKGFLLDEHHYFPKGKVMPVCGNTLLMLQKSRFEGDFDFIGNFETHYGLFEGCGKLPPYAASENAAAESNAQTSSGSSCC